MMKTWKFEIEDRKGLVRVVVAIANRNCGCLSTDPADCEKRGNIRAVGFWHRHDEDDLQNKLDEEADMILGAYRKMNEYAGALITWEWKDYRK